MARPITWQDVTAPNGGAALAASQAAGDTIVNSLKGLAGVAQGYVDTRKEDATREAVAGIMNSADPLAAAAAAAQGQYVDPLAVAQAAAAQDQRNRSNLASDASLEASKVSTQTNRAQLDDLISTRDAATIADDFIKKMPKSGDITGVDLTDERFNSAAGQKAYANILAESDRRAGRQLQREDLYLRKAAAEKDKLNQRIMDYEGRMISYGQSPKGLLADPAEKSRYAEQVAKDMQLPLSVIPRGNAAFDYGLTQNKPTGQELAGDAVGADGRYQVKPGDPDKKLLSFSDVIGLNNQAASNLQAQREATLNDFNGAFAVTDLTTPSPYAGLQEDGAVAVLMKNYGKDGLDLDDAKQQLRAFKQAAREGVEVKDENGKTVTRKGTLTDEQAAMLVGRMVGEEGWGNISDDWIVNNDTAKAAIAQLVEFNASGGAAGLQRRMAAAVAPIDRKLNALDRANQKVGANARLSGTGNETKLDKTSQATIDTFREAAEAAERAQKEEDDRLSREAAAREEAARKALEAQNQRRGPGYTLR